MDRMTISRLVSEMVDEVQGQSVARTVMKEVLEMVEGWSQQSLDNNRGG